MPFVETRLISPTTLTTSASSALYTVPTGYSAIIKQLVVTNITGTAATFTFYIGAASAGNALFSGTSVAANDTVIINLSQVLTTGEILRALASTNSALNLTVSGVLNDGPLASTATYIADNAITVNKIADGSVTSAKIAAGAVATVDLADASVSQLKIADGNSLINRFANATARDAAFGGAGEPTLAEGMTCYLDDTNVLQSYTGSAWVSIVSSTNPPALVKMLSVTSASTASILVDNCFSSEFRNYRVVMNVQCIDLAARYGRIQVLDGSGAAASSGYSSKCVFWQYNASTAAAAYDDSTSAFSFGPIGPDTNNIGDISVDIYNPFVTAPTQINGLQTGHLYGSYYTFGFTGGIQTSASSRRGFQVFANVGNIKGTVTVYGYRD